MKELNIKSRLHNEADVLEVDDKSLSEAVIPFIEADKDVISKIKVEYDEQTSKSTIIFPIGILPIKCYWVDSDYVYFDYVSGSLVDPSGDEIEDVLLIADYNKYVRLVVDNKVETTINELMYIHFSNELDAEAGGNWYKIFNPTYGTKLYRHALSLGGINWTGQNEAIFITTSSNTLTSFTENNIVSYMIRGSVRGSMHVFGVIGNLDLIDDDSATHTATIVSDTVTPL